ncbi:hypothetical protein MSAS_10340 [Mycobacterium saskatchewanense]|uniref:Uncharacterized protein n=1 Tax=Mycobacterium saskatchewanense TaxID=220927 RepID=A0AAJ3TWQ0_9MYCO|nr:hypothetical protein [Mycobacterium saskatchewanense]ORW74394.1 hypothetical protein AWC23_04820 [Mycobacterium saskatchewanense]BBX61860.1 hypothetical protein MSAS_10340 [Mycobacterium saskatchewanense]
MEEIAGKIFLSPEEAGVPPPTKEKIERARKMFAEFQEKVDAVRDEDRPKTISPKFWDDISGTEYEKPSQG